MLLFCLINIPIIAQNGYISGKVTDSGGEAIPGATILLKGTVQGTISDIDGNYSIKASSAQTLVFSFIGMKSQEIMIGNQKVIDVVLLADAIGLEDVVVVGYGIQKKESVVGAIAQVKGDDLMQAGGVTNVGEALQGRLPGVTTLSTSGMPGEGDPQIFIRGQSSWNGGGQPLILVDGIERPMSDIDMNEIEQMSVLKDASATAVFGVKGANGVIMITTKRGQTGKATLSLSANATTKFYSKLPQKMDSFDGINIANEAITRELAMEPTSWNDIVPYEILTKYRSPSSVEEGYMYPNVDWEDVVLKDYAMDYRVNLTVRGGSDFAKYFGSLAYQSVGDLFNASGNPNGKGYVPENTYDRFNYRSNLDFEISKTTKFSVNLSGFLAFQQKTSGDWHRILSSIYILPPSIYTPVYPDGYYGRTEADTWIHKNPVVLMSSSGYQKNTKFQMNTDFVLDQKLDFITRGLSFKGRLSYDNSMISVQNLHDGYDNVIYRYYDSNGNEVIHTKPGINDFDFVVNPWTLSASNVNSHSRLRRLNYELYLNYNRTFSEVHNTTALFLFKREEFAVGGMFPRFREDWVGRVTYNYDTRYFLDVNGAYNGSEKFGSEYRFELFPSAALGWMVSNESFMSGFEWLDKLKIKGSYGLVGDDNFAGRWKYMTQWASGGYAYLQSNDVQGQSPYLWYREDVVGNPDLHWETAVKSNIGFEVSVFRNMFSIDFDYFMEDRDDILIPGGARAIPDLFGSRSRPDANSGSVEVRGYELLLGFNHRFNNDLNLWADFNYTDARDEVTFGDDPMLKPAYQKAEGYPIGQSRSAIPGDIMRSWDDVYMSTPLNLYQEARRPGYYDLADYNSDGNYDDYYDIVPFGYPIRPQKTWSLTAGVGYKGFNLMAQFYGAQNATRLYETLTFEAKMPVYFEHMKDYWSVDNPDAEYALEPWSLNSGPGNDPRSYYYDASLVRLKTLELSYDVPKSFSKKIGLDALRLFVNGNNLFLWTKLPDDREYNQDDNNVQYSYKVGQYPTMKRINFGLNVTF